MEGSTCRNHVVRHAKVYQTGARKFERTIDLVSSPSDFRFVYAVRYSGFGQPINDCPCKAGVR